MYKVNAFCKKSDFWKSKEMEDGRIIVRFNEKTSGDFVEYSEAETENTVGALRELMTEAIEDYDKSPMVNSFVIDGKQIWLDRETRIVLRQRFAAEQATGATKTSLWYGTDVFNLSVEEAIRMLNEIEVYACKCYDVTAAHKAAVQKLATVEELLGYDNRTGYPGKLEFKTTGE
ncbi:MAG: DUF4376 domain-containing protein [Prevotella sp.]|jgi:hypothetical protein|nr:DUF4376 domain-containing protein [Prevotella sp.]